MKEENGPMDPPEGASPGGGPGPAERPASGTEETAVGAREEPLSPPAEESTEGLIRGQDQPGAEPVPDRPSERPRSEAQTPSAGPRPEEGRSASSPSQAPSRDSRRDKQDEPAGKERSIDQLLEGRQRISNESRDLHQIAANYFHTAHFDRIIVGQGQEQAAYSSQTGPRPRRARRLLDDEIKKIRAVYVEHVHYLDALETLRSQRVVILQGRPDVGKRAMAVRLAIAVAAEISEIRELSADVDLAEQVESRALDAGCTFLVDGLLSSRSARLTQAEWTAIRSDLQPLDSFLIICAGREARFSSELARGNVYQIVPPNVPAGELVKRHLIYLGCEPQEIESCLQLPEVKELLSSSLLPAAAERLARSLRDYIQLSCELEQALGGFAAFAEMSVKDWMDTCGTDLEIFSFRVALAVFSGTRFGDVKSAADDLADRLKRILPPEPKKDKKKKKKTKRPHPLERGRSRLLENSRARLRPATFATDYNERSVIPVVEYENAAYQPAILKYLWTEYHGTEVWDVLIGWLRECAGRGHIAPLRMRAAAAVGALAQLDFFSIRQEVLVPWVLEQDRECRAALSNAFGMIIWDDDLKEDVLGLLRLWSEKEDERYQWAAARAYAQVGKRFPGEAMERWRRIIRHVALEVELRITSKISFRITNPLFDSMLDAIFSLFVGAIEWETNFELIYEQLVTSLREWVEEDDKAKDKDGLGIPFFMLLMAIRLPTDNGDDEKHRPPALLVLVDVESKDSPYVRNLAWLIRRALDERPARPRVFETLREWLVCAQEDNNLMPPVTAVMQSLVQMPEFRQRQRDDLRVSLDRWARHPREPLPVAGDLKNDLGLFKS